MSLRWARAGYCCSIAALLVFVGSESLQNASADGETRTISFHHVHTKEDLTVTYKRNGRYDEAALKQINHVLRDWREQDPITMDPHLIDLLWEVHREVGAKEPISMICGYRSPGTNAMLRRRSSGVAKFSQHMTGKAIDFFIPGVALEDVRAAGLRSERGGVGIYPRRISFIWTPAACATGRECRRRNSPASCRRGSSAADSPPTTARSGAARWRRPVSAASPPSSPSCSAAARKTRGNDGSSGARLARLRPRSQPTRRLRSRPRRR